MYSLSIHSPRVFKCNKKLLTFTQLEIALVTYDGSADIRTGQKAGDPYNCVGLVTEGTD